MKIVPLSQYALTFSNEERALLQTIDTIREHIERENQRVLEKFANINKNLQQLNMAAQRMSRWKEVADRHQALVIGELLFIQEGYRVAIPVHIPFKKEWSGSVVYTTQKCNLAICVALTDDKGAPWFAWYERLLVGHVEKWPVFQGNIQPCFGQEHGQGAYNLTNNVKKAIAAFDLPLLIKYCGWYIAQFPYHVNDNIIQKVEPAIHALQFDEPAEPVVLNVPLVQHAPDNVGDPVQPVPDHARDGAADGV